MQQILEASLGDVAAEGEGLRWAWQGSGKHRGRRAGGEKRARRHAVVRCAKAHLRSVRDGWRLVRASGRRARGEIRDDGGEIKPKKKSLKLLG